MSSRSKPKWSRPKYRHAPDGRCGACGWQPVHGHAPSCATRFAELTTAEAVAEARLALMVWSDQPTQWRMREYDVNVSAITADFAKGISARAQQLGLEQDEAYDR